MAWLDLRRQVFAYILNRLKLFSDVDPDQLEVSLWTTSKVVLRDLEIDPDRIDLPGIKVKSATLKTTQLELSTQGVRIDVTDVDAVVVLKSKDAEMALSTFFERTTSDLGASMYESSEAMVSELNERLATGYGMGDASSMASKLAEMALAQLTVEVQNWNIKVLLADEAGLSLTIEKGLLKKDKISAHGIRVLSDQRIPAPGHAESSPVLSGLSSGTGDVVMDLSQSIYFDSQSKIVDKSFREITPLAPSDTSGPDSPPAFMSDKSQDSSTDMKLTERTTILVVDRLEVSFQVSARSFRGTFDVMRVNVIPALDTLAACLNIIFKFQDQEYEDDGMPLDFDVTFEEILLADCNITARGTFPEGVKTSTLKGLVFTGYQVHLESIDVPGLQIPGPVLDIDIGSAISCTIHHPISINISEDTKSTFGFLLRAVSSLARIEPPQPSTPSELVLDLPDIRLQLGDLVVYLFPCSASSTGIEIREIIVLADSDRVRIGELATKLDEESNIFISVQVLDGIISSHLHNSLEPVLASLTDAFGMANFSLARSNGYSKRVEFSLKKIAIEGFGTVVSGNLMARIAHGAEIQLNAAVRASAYTATGTFSLTKAEQLKVRTENLEVEVFTPANLGFEYDNTKEIGADTSSYEAVTEFMQILERIGMVVKCDLGCVVHVRGTETILGKARITGELNEANIRLRCSRIELSLIDGDAIAPCLTAHQIALNGVYETKTVSINTQKAVLSACTDSLSSLMGVLGQLQPQTRRVLSFGTVDVPLDVFQDIDHNAFVRRPSKKVPGNVVEDELPQKTPFVESYYQGGVSSALDPDSRASQLLDADLSELATSHVAFHNMQTSFQDSLNIHDSYMGPATPAPENDEDMRVPVCIAFSVERVIWNLHDGYDLASTRENITSAILRIEKQAAQLERAGVEDELPAVGDYMYNSIYIGTASNDALGTHLEQQVKQDLDSKTLCRSPTPKVVVEAAKSSLILEWYPYQQLGDLISTLELKVQSLIVRDRNPLSNWDTLLSFTQGRYYHDQDHPVIALKIASVVSNTPESRISAEISPIRLHIDQGTLDFVTRYFEFEQSAETVESNAPNGPSLVGTDAFIQRCEVMEIPICIDYMPRKVDYAGLRSGRTAEFMNMFALQGSKVVLRHAIVHGVPSYSSLNEALVNLWAPDIRDNQFASILVGLTPLRAAAKVAGSLRDLMVIPVREYRRDGTVLTGVRRGTLVFAQNTASQIFKVGLKLAKGSQAWLESAERVVGGGAPGPSTPPKPPMAQKLSIPLDFSPPSGGRYRSFYEDDHVNSAN